MDIEELWQRAMKSTEIIRARVQGLKTTSATQVPYILLSESTINLGDTVVRKGEVEVAQPSLIIPPHNPQFLGFDFDGEKQVDQNSFVNFLLVRGISLPSLRYDNKTSSLDIFEGKLSKAISYYNEQLQRKENVRTGLLTGPEDCWQFSLLIFICSQIARNADTDLRALWGEYHRRKHDQT